MIERSAHPKASEPFRPRRIVSGGQTGVDRGALEAAIAFGMEHGGWCPRGRLAEDGSIPSRYDLQEMDSPDYAARTEQNIIDSDATLILHEGPLRGGTQLTQRIAARLQKPLLTVRIDQPSTPQRIRQWLAEIRPDVLNIAGPRGSSSPGIEERACEVVLKALTGGG